MNFRPRQKEEPEINLIPFIDVLLVVLIFLMLSTTYSKFTELQLKLPVADADAQRDYPKEVIVAVSSDGRYSIKGVPVTGRSVEAVAQALERSGEGRQGQRGHHQRRRHRPAPVRHHRDGGGAPFGPEPDHVRHAVLGPGRESLTMAERLQRAWLRRGALACLLWPLSLVFGALAALRRGAYRAGLLKSERVAVPVIVVGNVVAGGVGQDAGGDGAWSNTCAHADSRRAWSRAATGAARRTAARCGRPAKRTRWATSRC